MSYKNGVDIQGRMRYVVRVAAPIVAVGLTLWWDPTPVLSVTAGLAIGLLTIALASATTLSYPTR